MDARVKLKPDEFTWAPNLSIGVEEMDHQHRQLVEEINTIIHKLNDGVSISADLKELETDMKAHFEEEEKFLAKIEYPDFENHKKIHKELISKLSLFVQAQEFGQLNFERLGSFLRMWLKSHILGVDRKYAYFLENKKTSV